MSIRETNKWLIPVLPPTEFAEFLPQSVVIYNVWDILENAYKKEMDIMIVAIDFSFGISLEVEEHSCSVTSWGL